MLPAYGLDANPHDQGGGEGAFGDRERAGRFVLCGQGLEGLDLEGLVLHQGGHAGAADAAVAGRGLFDANVHCRAEADPGVMLDQVKLATFGGAVDKDAVPVQHEVEQQDIGELARVEGQGDDVRFAQDIVHEGRVGDLAILSSHSDSPENAVGGGALCSSSLARTSGLDQTQNPAPVRDGDGKGAQGQEEAAGDEGEVVAAIILAWCRA